MPKLNDLSRSLVTLEQDATLIAVIEMGQSSWLVAGIVPGVERQPLKKLAVDESALLKLLNRWREEAEQAEKSCRRRALRQCLHGLNPRHHWIFSFISAFPVLFPEHGNTGRTSERKRRNNRTKSYCGADGGTT